MIKSRPKLPLTAEEYLTLLDRLAFINSRREKDPENWDFQVGYWEAAGTRAHDPNSDDWFVLAIYKPSMTNFSSDGKQKQATVVILNPDGTSTSPGNGHQDSDGIWMWDTD